MTPKKDRVKNRDAAVVYPGTSPELMLAYRIFGPGYESLDALAQQRKSIIREEGWETWLTPQGMDIGRSLNVDVDKIIAAYEAYKKDIERMNKVDRIHNKRKQAQLDGVDAEDEDGDGDDSDGVELVSSSSSGSGSGSGAQDDNEGGSDEAEEEDEEDDEEDPLKQFLGPNLWLSKEEALSRTRTLRASIEEMHATVGSILDNYAKDLLPSKEASQAVHKFVKNFLKVRTYAYLQEHLIKLHDNKTPESTWKSPDTVNVTYGDKVPETLHRFYKLQGQVEEMQKSLAFCKLVRDRFLNEKLRDKKVQLMRQLMFNMRRFASMCCEEEARPDFLKELEEERKQWSESPPAEQ